MARTRCQSVRPSGAPCPRSMRTRVVPVLLMSCGPSGGNDAAEILVAHGRDDEQNVSGRHADGVYPLLTIGETVVDILDPDRIEQRADRVEEIDPMFGHI